MALNATTFEFLTTEIGSGTDTEILAMWRAYLASIPLMGTVREIRGRKVTLPDADKTMEIIQQLEARIAAASGTSATNYFSRQRPL